MFYMNLDLSAILRLDDQLLPAANAAAKSAARALTTATHAHIVEEVSRRLHSTKDKYMENLAFHQVDDTTWVIDLKKAAFFIEEGLPPNFDMIDSLLDDSPKTNRPGGQAKSRTKTAKDGSRYRVIPFDQNKGPSRQTPAQNNLTDAIKSELKKQKLPGLGTIERDANGNAKEGFIRGLNITNRPLKSAQGAGMGHGPIGAVRQGPTGIPFLQGVRIYQKNVVDKQGNKHMKKFAMTFRIVSSKHKGQGRWVHPGLEPRKFLDEAFTWALREWETKIGPEIAQQFGDSL